MSPNDSPRAALKLFIAKVAGGVLLLLSALGSILAILDIVSPVHVVIVSGVFIGLCGWAAALYISYFRKGGEPVTEKALRSLRDQLPIPYLETWLRSTLLNEEALARYWHASAALDIVEIRCETIVSANDVTLRIGFSGSNRTRQPAEYCPMLMFGGSVIHLTRFPQEAVIASADGSETRLHVRNVLDLGQIHYVEMLFPVPLVHRMAFEVEHRHAWPGAMADGEDTLWYPYAAFFANPPSRMLVRVTFDEPPSYVRGLSLSLANGAYSVPESQPAVCTGSVEFEWHVDPVDNDSLYGLVFGRKATPSPSTHRSSTALPDPAE